VTYAVYAAQHDSGDDSVGVMSALVLSSCPLDFARG